MKKVLFNVLGLLFAVSMSGQIRAQTPVPVEPLADGVVDFIPATEIEAADKNDSGDVSMLRVRSFNKGEYNVGIALLHRPKTPAGKIGGGIEEHIDITEVYYVIKGHATFVTGGTLLNAARQTPINTKIGPGYHGTTIEGGVSREVGPGDMIIIPPMTPHWWKEIRSDELAYTVVRIDPHRVLSMPPTPPAKK